MHTRVIAEIGANHGGSLETAKRLMVVAHDAGCWGVKTQVRGPDYLHESLRARPYIGPHSYGETYGEHRDALELTGAQHNELKMVANSFGLKYGFSMWDESSFGMLAAMQPDFLKIPSAEAGNIPFVKKVATQKCDVFASVGMCRFNQRNDLIEVLGASAAQHDGPNDRIIMHCVSAYPCEESELYLDSIDELKGIVDPERIDIGFSDHTKGIAMSLAAAAMGATWIERHITLDRTSKGTDHAASLEPDGLRRLCRDLRNLGNARGEKEFIQECEKEPFDKLVRTAVAERNIAQGEDIVLGCVKFQACGVGLAGLKPADVNVQCRTVANRSICEGDLILESDVEIGEGTHA